jgi:peptide/nickel transport system ATP-binding protein
MRQRAAIAMALACGPQLLIADEPTTALDTMVEAQIFDLLCHLSDELGIALMLVTHDLPVVMQVCSRAAVMYAGRIVEEGTVEQLFDHPRHPYTARLFAATPDLRAGGAVRAIPGTPPRLDLPIVGCAFSERCDRRFERCVERPPLLELAARQRVACWLHEGRT